MLTTLALSALLMHAPAQSGNWSLIQNGAVAAKLGYFPVPIKLSSVRPSSIRKEPVYSGTPLYGTVKVGDGPRSQYTIAIDVPASGNEHIFVDANQNGDLTDDPAVDFGAPKGSADRPVYGPVELKLRASYGSANRETSSSSYSIMIYRLPLAQRETLFSYRASSREGTVTIDGKTHKAMIVENDADAVFNKPVVTEADAQAHRPVWLRVDLNDDGKYQTVDARAPFALGGKNFEATVAADGSRIDVRPTNKPVPEFLKAKAAPPAKPLLSKGSLAPDFVVEKWGGGDLKLSDYRGHVVVLDFWATWCGPCQKSMPHIESVFENVKNQDVVVIGVSVWDQKDAYNKWVPDHQKQYGFQFAFDPAGRDMTKSVASNLYHVNGIPTTYIIDKDGKVVDSVVGYEDGDKRVEAALTQAGVHVKS